MLTLDLSVFPVLRTERLILRELTPDDATALFALRADPLVMRHIGRPMATTLDDAVALIAAIARERAAHGGITWAITLAGDDRVIGTIGFYRLKLEHHRAEVGYMLAAAHWRKGIMGEALRAVVTNGFERFHFHTLEAVTDPRNTASRTLLERNGFVLEGLFREDHYRQGEFEDSAVYSRMEHAYRAVPTAMPRSFEELPWKEVAQGAREKRVTSGGRSMRLLELTPAFHEPDWCMAGHHGQILAGEVVVQRSSGAVHLKEGDLVWLDAGTPHKAVVPLGGLVRLLLFERD